MQLNLRQQKTATPAPQILDWSNTSDLKPLQQEYQPDTWVHLLELPSTFSYDQALLLCQVSEDEWVAWIPAHGEALLHTRQFMWTNDAARNR